MSDRIAAVEAYQNGIVKDDDGSVAGYLANDVVVETNFGRGEQQTLPAAPAAPAELRLTGEIKSAVDGALDNQTPMMIAYSDSDGEIHLSFRGSIQAYSGGQLAVWARDPGGGLPRHIAQCRLAIGPGGRRAGFSGQPELILVRRYLTGNINHAGDAREPARTRAAGRDREYFGYGEGLMSV